MERRPLWGAFDGPGDVPLAAVQALSNAASRTKTEKLAPRAEERAAALADGNAASGRYGSVARVSFAPLLAQPLLDAVALDQPGLDDVIADLVRAHRLIPHSVGIKGAITREGITVTAAGSYSNMPQGVIVGADGAVMCEVDVSGSDQFGSSRVDPERLRAGIAAAGAFALDV